ncbi:MAG: hypothetical protein IE921_09865 [Rhodobacteraceae bacterium]|nr:hypothetical protein [Paracoccaceae bacterium]
MSVFGKIVGVGVFVTIAGISGLSAIGSNLESEFEAQAIAQSEQPVDAEPRAPLAKAPQNNHSSHEPMTEAERIAITQIDPDMKAASDAVAGLINLNGHLCADVIDVVPASGAEL